ncbi:hypothetical protein GC169_09130 [bacterium]|nr:hypothetical protein [bacterium]
MDFSSYLRPAETLLATANAILTRHPAWAGAAIAVVSVLALMMLASLALAVATLARSAQSAAQASRIRRSDEPGAKVILARSADPASGFVRRQTEGAIETHIGDYMFGGAFNIVRTSVAVRDAEHAERFLRTSGGDILVWTERDRKGVSFVRVVSRPDGSAEKVRPARAFRLPKEKAAWTPALMRAIAYGVAKHYRPALGRPQDFRPERLRPVVDSLVAILAERPKADSTLLLEMNDDLAAGALQLALAGEEDWIERCVEIARNGVAEISRAASPDRWAAAKITLGRALKLRCERRFDPVMLQESITHLTEAMEALRAEPRFKLAEAAAQTISDAQRLLANRRRFSISAGGI